jgi:hypothetical protein
MAGRPEKFVGFRSFLEAKWQELEQKRQNAFEISFPDIVVQGCPLPPSAYRHRGWWANNSSKVWVRAHFHVQKVDMQNRSVTFMRTLSSEEEAQLKKEIAELFEAPASWKGPRPAKDVGRDKGPHPAPGSILNRLYAKEVGRDKKPHPLFGAMKGTIRVVAGTDLTAPADPDWGKVYDK